MKLNKFIAHNPIAKALDAQRVDRDYYSWQLNDIKFKLFKLEEKEKCLRKTQETINQKRILLLLEMAVARNQIGPEEEKMEAEVVRELEDRIIRQKEILKLSKKRKK